MKNNFKLPKDGKNKKAFTLAEALVVILIIGIVAGAAINNMSKKTTKRSDEAQHGQYACWVDPTTNKMCEQYVTGRRVDSPRCLNRCSFTPNRKIASHIVYIVGAGVGNGIQGQFIAGSLGGAEITNETPIILGGSSADILKGGTSFGGREDLFAKNGTSSFVADGLVTENIRTCRVVSVDSASQGSKCVTKFDTDTSAIVAKYDSPAISCDFESDGDRVGQKGRIIRINGCKALAVDRLLSGELVYNEISAMIPTARLTPVGDTKYRQYVAQASDAYPSGYMSPYANDIKYTINIQLKDSDYVPAPVGQSAVSKMSVLLEKLPKFRQSDLAKRIHSLNPGVGANGKGAVFIMW